MALSERENYLRTVRFEGGEWIPMSVSISGASWAQWKEEMEEVVLRHPTIFRGFRKGQVDFENMQYGPKHREGEYYTDEWGCVWYSAIGGIEGQVIGHPLEDWGKLEGYRPPHPLPKSGAEAERWERRRREIREAKERGELTSGGVEHGFLLMRLTYLRGFENLMLDIATGDPRLPRLIEMLVEHNKAIVDEYLRMGVDQMTFGEDLGTQTASVISPKHFREWMLPAYQRLMQRCRRAGTLVYLHSDGYIMELMDLFIEAGVDIINPQDLCNGIDALAREVKGRMCIALDVDRQRVVPFGTRREIKELIKEEVMKLGSPRGGLTMVCGIYPPTPPENVDALCEAMEEWREYWRGRH